MNAIERLARHHGKFILLLALMGGAFLIGYWSNLNIAGMDSGLAWIAAFLFAATIAFILRFLFTYLSSEKALFIKYIKLLVNEWQATTFLIADAIAYGIIVANPDIPIPPLLFWLLAVIVLGYAGYNVYREALPEESKPKKPELMISLVEGRSFEFSLVDVDERTPHFDDDEEVPSVWLKIYVQMMNPTTLPLQLLNIDATVWPAESYWTRKYDSDNTPLQRELYMHMDVLLPEGESLPITLDKNDSIRITLRGRILFRLGAVQVAARLKQMTSKPVLHPLGVRVEALVPEDELITFGEIFDISALPLRDLLIEWWQNEGEGQLVELAKG